MDRRDWLAGLGAVGAGTLSGCLGVFGGNESPDGLRLQTIEAPGSPGGERVVVPTDRVTLLDFFATWCLPCKSEMEHLNVVRDRYDPSELAMVSITQEQDRTAIRQFWRRYNGSWPVAIDSNATAYSAYGVQSVPVIVVRRPDGTETLRHNGLAGTDRLIEGVERALE